MGEPHFPFCKSGVITTSPPRCSVPPESDFAQSGRALCHPGTHQASVSTVHTSTATARGAALASTAPCLLSLGGICLPGRVTCPFLPHWQHCCLCSAPEVGALGPVGEFAGESRAGPRWSCCPRPPPAGAQAPPGRLCCGGGSATSLPECHADLNAHRKELVHLGHLTTPGDEGVQE